MLVSTQRVDDEYAPDDFQMIVPLLIEFDDDKFLKQRVVIRGKETTVDLPLLPLKPTGLVFNFQRAVLAQTKNVRWKN